MIFEIPKQRNVTILPPFAIVDKSSYHAVSRNAFLNSRSEEKTFSLAFIPGKSKSKCGFVVCILIGNGYASLLFSQIMFSYCLCMLSEFVKAFERKVAHLHNAARALSSRSRCFQLSTNFNKDFLPSILTIY